MRWNVVILIQPSRQRTQICCNKIKNKERGLGVGRERKREGRKKKIKKEALNDKGPN